MVLQPRGSKLPSSVLQPRKERASLFELGRQGLDSPDLGCHLAELTRRVGVQLREPPLGGSELRLGRARPAAGLVCEHAELALDRGRAGDDLA